MREFLRNVASLLAVTTLMGLSVSASLAQDQTASSEDASTPEEAMIEDEVIATGTLITGQHDGMDAFFRGDFETAEIEFEREFKSLRRFESARENAARDADLATDRASAVTEANSNPGSSVNSRGGGVPIEARSTTSNSGLVSSFNSKRSEGRSILTDGQITYQDFGFARYMSGVSEIKLGKFEEAKKSLKQSLRYDENNFDAVMRLGLLYLMDGDFEQAGKHLEKLDQLRKKCQRKSCDNQDAINEATVTLAKQITQAAQTG